MSDADDSVSKSNGNGHLDPTLDFLAGTTAGVSGLVVGFPFDTVKYRFQNPSPGVRYHSTLHALTTITREERLSGLYRGISSPLATAPLLNGLLFATYRFLTKLQTHHQTRHEDNDVQLQRSKDDPEPELEPTLGQIFLAGAGCGLASTLLTTPIELIKIQQQKQQQQLTALTHNVSGLRRSSSSEGHMLPARAVAQQIYRTGGIRGLYRGLSATILRDVGGYGLYFFGYEGTLRLFAPANPAHHADPALVLDEVADTLSRTNPRPWAWTPLLLAGGAAGILGWLGTFPFDVIKTRMQAHNIGTSAHTGTGTGTGSSAGEGTLWRATRELYAEAGGGGGAGGRMRVFWRGFVPTIVRAVPVNMAVFGTFEGVVWAFS